MPSEPTIPETMDPTVTAGAAEWLTLSDELLVGLVHALNNRVTALSVCAELTEFGDREVLGDGVLLAEVARLQRAGALLGLLPARGQAEALEIAPVLHDAVAIHSHHPRSRTVRCAVEIIGTPQPVRVPRWALLRLLLIMIDAAKAVGRADERREVAIELSGDSETVRVRAPARLVESTYGVGMATLCGGVLAREGEELVLSLPSLTALRRDERKDRV
jgi:hypothetical protein